MWNNLTMSERAGVIKMAVKAGLRDMQSIRKFYDDSLKYAEGGPLPEYLERPKEYSLKPFTIVSKTPKKEVEGNWEVEKNVRWCKSSRGT